MQSVPTSPRTTALVALATLFITVSILACGDGPTGTRSQLTGEIAFASNRDGASYGIYLTDAAGTRVTLLTKTQNIPFCLSWSPDGSRLAFAETLNKRDQILVLDVAAGSQTQITQGPLFNTCPAWAPDGRHIAYYSGEQANAPGGFDPGYPRRWRMILMAPDGSAATAIANRDYIPNPTSWSPDGTQLIAERVSDFTLVIVDVASGAEVASLAATPPAWWPTWSPDGETIAFSSQQRGDLAVYSIRRDGTAQRRLSPDTVGGNTAANWSPDGKRIVFQQLFDTRADPADPKSALVTNWEIVIANADGSNPVNITRHVANDEGPVWRPRR